MVQSMLPDLGSGFISVCLDAFGVHACLVHTSLMNEETERIG
jgi:hypothetical protein